MGSDAGSVWIGISVSFGSESGAGWSLKEQTVAVAEMEENNHGRQEDFILPTQCATEKRRKLIIIGVK